MSIPSTIHAEAMVGGRAPLVAEMTRQLSRRLGNFFNQLRRTLTNICFRSDSGESPVLWSVFDKSIMMFL